MKLFQRIFEGIKNFLRRIFGRKKSPEEEVDEIIIHYKESLAEVKNNVAEVKKGYLTAEKDLADCDRKIAELEAAAKKSLMAGDENQARRFLGEKQSFVRMRENLQEHYNDWKKNSDAIEQAYYELVCNIRELEQRKSSAKAKMAAAQAKEQINMAYQYSRASLGDTVIKDYEQKAQREEDIAQAYRELNGESMFARYDSEPLPASVDRELEELRRQLQEKSHEEI